MCCAPSLALEIQTNAAVLCWHYHGWERVLSRTSSWLQTSISLQEIRIRSWRCQNKSLVAAYACPLRQASLDVDAKAMSDGVHDSAADIELLRQAANTAVAVGSIEALRVIALSPNGLAGLGVNALDMAARYDQSAVVQFLLCVGLDMSSRSKGIYAIV